MPRRAPNVEDVVDEEEIADDDEIDEEEEIDDEDHAEDEDVTSDEAASDSTLTDEERDTFRRLLLGEIRQDPSNPESPFIDEYIKQIKAFKDNIDSPKIRIYKRSLILDYAHVMILDEVVPVTRTHLAGIDGEGDGDEDAGEEEDHEPPLTSNDIAQKLIDNPDQILIDMESILETVIDAVVEVGYSRTSGPFKIRVKNVNTKASGFAEVSSEKMDRLIEIRGMVVRIGVVYPKLRIATFRCDRCGAVTHQAQGLEGQYIAPSPCHSEDCHGKTPVRSWKWISRESRYVDFQHVFLQENCEHLSGAEDPQPIHAFLTGDVCAIVNPGAVVRLTGVLRGIPHKFRLTEDSYTIPLLEKGFWVSHCDIKQDVFTDDRPNEFSEDEFWDKVSIMYEGVRYYGDQRDTGKPLFGTPVYQETIVPDIFQRQATWEQEQRNLIGSGLKGGVELEMIKEAVRLMLYNAIPWYDKYGSDPHRWCIHIMIVGEPGVGKTRLGRSIEALCDRYMYGSAILTTGVGLTAAVTKDEFGDKDAPSLKGGILVLADGGICAIDEFDKFPINQVHMLLEQLESLKISVHKGGFHRILKARSSVLALANPKNIRYDFDAPVEKNVDLDPAIISRMDLIFLLYDIDRSSEGTPEDRLVRQEKHDRDIIRHMMRGDTGEEGEETPIESTEEMQRKVRFFREYVRFAKRFADSRIDPRNIMNVPIPINNDACNVIEEYYISLRRTSWGDNSTGIQASNRQGESLKRLAIASAKANLRLEATVRDADKGVDLMKHTIRNMKGNDDPLADISALEGKKGAKGMGKTEQEKRNLAILYNITDGNKKAVPREAYVAAMASQLKPVGKKTPEHIAESRIAEYESNGYIESDGAGLKLSSNGYSMVPKRLIDGSEGNATLKTGSSPTQAASPPKKSTSKPSTDEFDIDAIIHDYNTKGK